MKKFSFVLMAAIAFSAALSCNKEVNETPVDTPSTGKDNASAWHFTANVENPVTKMGDMDASGDFAWENGDEITILYDGGSTTATATIASGVTTFDPVIPDGTTDVWMVYPSTMTASLDGGNLVIGLPGVQKDALSGYFVAKASAGDASVSFKHPVGYYRFVLDGDGVDVSRVTLSSAAGNNLTAASLSLSFDSEGVPAVSAVSGSSSLTIDFSGAGTYYVPVIPGIAPDANDLTFQFYRGDARTEKAGAYKHAKAVENARAGILNWASLPAMATNRYVSTSGSASNNGATPGKAWNIAQLRTFLGRTDLSLYDGVNIRIAAGTYTLDANSYFKPKVSVKLNIIGAGASTTVINANSKTTPIDLTDGSYTGLLTFKNMTFKNATQTNNGAVIRANASVKAVFEGCVFENNIVNKESYGGGVFNAWGSAVLTFKDCSFIGNSGTTYGGVSYVQGTTKSTFEGCTFIGNHSISGGVFYISGSAELICTDCNFGDGTDKNKNYATGQGGVLYMAGTNTSTIDGCTFDYNESQSNWGSCIYLYSSTDANRTLYVNDCLFKNNKTQSRGVIGANSAMALIFMNNVTFADNTVTASGNVWGVAVHAGKSVMCMNNVTAYNNSGTNASVGSHFTFNADGGWLITNSTVVDNCTTGVVRANNTSSNGARKQAFCNNIFINRNTAANVFTIGGTASSAGNNVLSYSGSDPANFSSVTSDLKGITSLTAGQYSEPLYTWTNNLNGFTPADAATVKAVYDAYDESIAGVSHVGNAFYTWLTEIGAVGKDARGVTRGTPWWPGAYQN